MLTYFPQRRSKTMMNAWNEASLQECVDKNEKIFKKAIFKKVRLNLNDERMAAKS